jgi:hypothetical protein
MYMRLRDSLKRSSVTFKTTFVEELTKATCKGIRILLTTHGYGSRWKRTGKEQRSIDHIVDLLSPLTDGEAVKALKYLTATYMPVVGEDDQMPERPPFLDKDSTLFKYEYGAFVGQVFRLKRKSHHKKRNHCGTRQVTSESEREGSRRNRISLAMSILQLKRYMPALPESLQLDARKGLKERLTSPAKSPSRLIDEVARTANELFPPGWDKNIPIPSYVASRASCCQNSRGGGGIQAYVFSEDRPDAKNASRQIIGISHGVQDILQWDPHMRDLPFHPNEMTREQFEDLALRTMPEEFHAVVEIVEDPLKARVITKNEWQCQVLKALQKMIHGVMRKHPAFQLIGKTIDEEVIAHLLWFKGSKWVSGDYSAATDNFHSDVTEASIEVILGNMKGRMTKRPEMMLLARRSLTGLTIRDSVLKEEYKMSRGQLMGSLLSFPILCLVNFAIWRHSAELAYGKRCNGMGMGGDSDRVLINGDDIGFAATPAHYELWKGLVPKVGLEPSLGKNYYTSEFITLNTRVFTWSSGSGWESIPFLNLGLLVRGGSDAKNGQTKFGKLEALGQMHDDFVAGAEFAGVASMIFLSNWKDLLKSTVRNLFGPKELGGLGAHPVKGSRGASLEGYTWRQRMIATLLRDGKIHLPATGISPLYAQYEIAYARMRFPGVEKFREAELPPLPMDYAWENVTEVVENASASFRTRVSWLAPSGDTERPLRNLWAKAEKFSLWREYKSAALQRLEDYLNWPDEVKYHYRKVYEPFLAELHQYDLSEEADVYA